MIPKILRFLFVSVLVVAFSATAHAQATRTWVSGVGNDADPCSRTAPCKTFAGAISKTAAGGEISVLDPGGFGAVTINKSITLNGTGTLASVLAALVNGIVVNAGANDTVIIRDISINGAGTGLNGIRYIGGGTLMVDHCSIYAFKASGTNSRAIDVALTNNGNLKVFNSVIENISGDGIRMTTTSGLVQAIIDNTQIMNCGVSGIDSVSNVRGAISNSRVIQNINGIRTSGGNSQLNLDDVLISYSNNVGLQSSAGSSIRVSDSVIANNSSGLSPNGGTIDSFQGNSLIGNPVPGSFSSTTPKQ